MEELKSKIEEVLTEIVRIKYNINLLVQIANDKDLPGKVAEVCKEFGNIDNYDGECNYRGDNLSIYMMRAYIRVKVEGSCVFETSLYENKKGSIDLYKPGDWEAEIDTLLKQIPERKLAIKLQYEENILYRLKEKWGMK